MTVEDAGAAGLGGSDISDDSLKLASGVYIGEAMGQRNAIPAPPKPPPPPRMRLGHKPEGVEMMARPRADLAELSRDWELMHPAVRWIGLGLVCVVVGELVALLGVIHL